MAEVKLPADFFFGAAMSGPQTEGGWKLHGKIESVWDKQSKERIDSFYNKVGSYVGNDMVNRYQDDFRMLADLGLSSVRTSFQWTRLLDRDGHLNTAGADFYHKMLSAAKEEGIDLFVNLYHFDMPSYIFARGGWENRETVEAYVNYARTAFHEFGGEVKHWFTFNEPVIEPESEYYEGRRWPYIMDFQRMMTVQYHITLAHALAVREFRIAQERGDVRPDARIGLINAFATPYTKENPQAADLEAVRMTDGLHNRWWLDLAADGTIPQDVIETIGEKGITLPVRPGDEDIIPFGKVDWLGLNYYRPTRVQAPESDYDEKGRLTFSSPYEMPNARMNESRGWEIYPKGIYDFAMKIKNEHPDMEFFVSENGMGVEGEEKFKNAEGVIQDDYRIEFVKEHLEWVAKAIEDGANCVGYHYWAVIDNWSWNNAFKNRYGFIGVDLAHNYDRHYKKSASWLRELTRTHVIE